MSKIFEALYRQPEQLPDVDLDAVFAGGLAAPAVTASPEAGETQPKPAAAPEAMAGPPSLANLPGVRVRVPAHVPLLPFDGSHRRAGEQYRVLRTKILHHPRQPQMIVVSSSGPADGKTVTAVNLAAALAMKNDSKVLLIDGDLRRHNLSELLGLSERPGLGDVLSGQCTMEQALVRIEQFPKLHVFPAGVAPVNPTELLDSERWRQACAMWRAMFKHIIVDVPPVGSTADYELVQAASDGVLLVIRIDHTDRKHCTDALALIPHEKLLGTVLNCVRDWFLWKAHDYYYYSK